MSHSVGSQLRARKQLGKADPRAKRLAPSPLLEQYLQQLRAGGLQASHL
jgi:hypothetical protein